MSQPRIDTKMVIGAARALKSHWDEVDCEACGERLDDLIGELDDCDDGATILIALTKQEADVVLAALRALQRECEQGRARLAVSRIAALDGAIEEINAAIRGVVVQNAN